MVEDAIIKNADPMQCRRDRTQHSGDPTHAKRHAED